jgi:hypothetical protein
MEIILKVSLMKEEIENGDALRNDVFSKNPKLDYKYEMRTRKIGFRSSEFIGYSMIERDCHLALLLEP